MAPGPGAPLPTPVRRSGPRAPAVRSAAVALAVSVAAACTAPPADRTTGGEVPPPRAGSPSPVVLPVVADLAAEGEDPNPYLDGMRLAAREAASGGGVGGRAVELRMLDHGGNEHRAVDLLREAVRARPPGILFAGPASAVASARPVLERADVPVLLLEGDLYSSAALFREVFQTSLPWVWQAHVLARYVVRDRRAARVAFAGVGAGARGAALLLDRALAYWGGNLHHATLLPTGGPVARQDLEELLTADHLVVFGPPGEELALASAIEEASGREGPAISGSSALLVPSDRLAQPDPGTTACYLYTWAAWARPIPRVGRFVERFRSAFAHDPLALEQEGFDAVRVLVEGLRATGGQGGERLITALEEMEPRAFSSYPVAFGPDDHLFPPRDELGLFAVPGPGERLDPWQQRGRGPLWRPVMRTFTYDGERVVVLDQDKPILFPFWDKPEPSPQYWRSRYGIVTRPSDPLH